MLHSSLFSCFSSHPYMSYTHTYFIHPIGDRVFADCNGFLTQLDFCIKKNLYEHTLKEKNVSELLINPKTVLLGLLQCYNYLLYENNMYVPYYVATLVFYLVLSLHQQMRLGQEYS